VWDPRVLRAAAGAHFHVNIIDDVGWESMVNYFEPSQDKAQFFLVDVTPRGTGMNDNLKVDSNIICNMAADEPPVRRFTPKRFDLNVREYDAVDYNIGDTVLIVSSSEGSVSSQDARKLVYIRSGDVITLPTVMDRDVKLNLALTASIVLFEIKRQKITSSNNVAEIKS